MPGTYNIYCDESCHLENDHQKAMVLGAVYCPLEKRREISVRLRQIKQRHGMAEGFEVKWTKVSPAKIDFYRDVLDYFFDDDDLHFRAVVVPDKTKLNHPAFGQDHDQWYYKMFFVLLKHIFQSGNSYKIYIDIKDTRSQQKVTKLHDVLCNNFLDFDRRIIANVQHVRSHEVEILQICDLLIGALSYLHRGVMTSRTKLTLLERFQHRAGFDLRHTTLPREDKVNILIWGAQEW
jgi:hypothetical protein